MEPHNSKGPLFISFDSPWESKTSLCWTSPLDVSELLDQHQ